MNAVTDTDDAAVAFNLLPDGSVNVDATSWVEVTYTGGWTHDTLPTDIIAAVCLLADGWQRHNEHPDQRGATQIALEGASVTRQEPDAVAALERMAPGFTSLLECWRLR